MLALNCNQILLALSRCCATVLDGIKYDTNLVPLAWIQITGIVPNRALCIECPPFFSPSIARIVHCIRSNRLNAMSYGAYYVTVEVLGYLQSWLKPQGFTFEYLSIFAAEYQVQKGTHTLTSWFTDLLVQGCKRSYSFI